jgi:hypothetical protein
MVSSGYKAGKATLETSEELDLTRRTRNTRSIGMPRKKEKRRRTLLKPRTFLVPIMNLSRKSGAQLDRKKEARRRACRSRLVFEE